MDGRILCEDLKKVVREAKAMGCKEVRTFRNVPIENVETIIEALELKQMVEETEDEIVRCPKCGSVKIFQFRLDADWSRNCRYTPVNDEDLYSEDELKSSRPDVDIYHCLGCNHLFENV